MLQIYNTYTHKKELFKPRVPGHIDLYVCGITVYDFCHLGHARVFVAFDMIVRFLRASGWQVKYVRNITDIDDKIIKRALENQESIEQLTARFIQAMNEDTKALNTLSPTEEPKATQSIDKIIDLIQQLQNKGFAYQGSNGDVYFQIDKYTDYGQLAHKDLESLQSGARVEVSHEKCSPLDFVLWKKAKATEPSWPSPWGEGRPGWHIECSAMSMASLGETFDIHGGGADLIFPHHENERAQSECASGKRFVNYWMHVGFVQVDKEKMSKSLGNFFTIREILNEYDPEVVRYFLLASHYRSPVNFSQEQLNQSKNTIERLYTTLRGINLSDNPLGSYITNSFYQRFFAAMNDDFNTPIALAVLFDLVHAINSTREKNEVFYQELATLLKKLANILGLLERHPDEYLQGREEHSTEINQLIKERELARAQRQWQRADEIRQRLMAMNVVLEDTVNGTIWRKA